MYSKNLVWVLLACCGASLVGCEKDDAEPVALDGLAARYAEVYCNRVLSCCQEHGQPSDSATCRTNASTSLQASIDELKQRKVGYDEQAAGDCMAAIAAIDGCDGDEIEGVPACERVFYGLVAAGGACRSGQECQVPAGKSASCEKPADATETTEGTCKLYQRVSQKHGAAGDACTGTCGGSECSVTLFEPAAGQPAPQPRPGENVSCYRTENLHCGADNTCQPLGAVGSACADYDGCAGDAFCDLGGSLGTGSRTCMARRPAGAACERGDECESDRCSDAGKCEASPVSDAECRGAIDD